MSLNKQNSPAEMRKGQTTRQQILAVAADLASPEGLEGLTIGKLATSLGISKSGLYAHFGSKEDLQLAVIDLAQQRFEAEVFPAVEEGPDGLPKLHVLSTAWADSIEHSSCRGAASSLLLLHCGFFAVDSAEFDDRPSPVPDEIARLKKVWLDLLKQGFDSAWNLKCSRMVPPTDYGTHLG